MTMTVAQLSTAGIRTDIFSMTDVSEKELILISDSDYFQLERSLRHCVPQSLAEVWFIVDCKWLETLRNSKRLSRLNNSQFVDFVNNVPDDHSVLIPLNSGLFVDVDFTLVSHDTWQFIRKLSLNYKFDIDREISRSVHRTSTFELSVEVFPRYFYISRCDSDGDCDDSSIIRSTFSCTSTLSSFISRARTKLKIEASHPVRLWKKYSSSFELVNVDELWKKPIGVLKEFCLDGECFLFESKHSSIDAWPRDSVRIRDNENNNHTMTSSSSALVPASLQSESIFSPAKKRQRKPGTCGIANMGNTCFMNSALQCLLHTKPLVEYFMSRKFLEDLNGTNPLGYGGRIAKEFASLVQTFYGDLTSDVVYPRDLKWLISQHAPQFSGYSQNDSQEFLAFLLDGLHEDLNKVLNKPYTPERDDEDDVSDKLNTAALENGRANEQERLSDNKKATEAWDRHVSRNKSVIVDMFHGLYKSKLTCPNCDKQSVKFDPCLYLSVPIPVEKPVREMLVHVVHGNERGDVISHENVTMKDCSEDYGDVQERLVKQLNISTSEDVFVFLMVSIDSQYLTKPRNSRFLESSRDSFNKRTAVFLVCREVIKKLDDQVTAGLRAIIITEVNSESRKLLGLPRMVLVSDTDRMRDLSNHVSCLFSNRGSWHVHRQSSFDDELNHTSNDDIIITVGDTFRDDSDSIAITYYYSTNVDQEDSSSSIKLSQDTEFSKDGQDKKKTKPSTTIYDCLNLYCARETLGEGDEWYCSRCKDHVRAYKQISLWKLPEILIIHLKRFQFQRGYSRGKISETIKFPCKESDELLDLSQYMPSSTSDDESWKYKLFAVSDHSGGLFGGHYWTCADVEGKWFKFDDSSFYPFTSEMDCDSSFTAYILFFKRVQ